MSSLIAFGTAGERHLACRGLATDPGPQATVRLLAEIWMVTCKGRLDRVRRILLRRDWEQLDDEIVGPMPASMTTAEYRVVAGVGIAQPVRAPNHADRVALADAPGTAQHLYVLPWPGARSSTTPPTGRGGGRRVRYSLRRYLPPDRTT